jgi:hypothetical protein
METCIFQVVANFSNAGGIRRALLPPGRGGYPYPQRTGLPVRWCAFHAISEKFVLDDRDGIWMVSYGKI